MGEFYISFSAASYRGFSGDRDNIDRRRGWPFIWIELSSQLKNSWFVGFGIITTISGLGPDFDCSLDCRNEDRLEVGSDSIGDLGVFVGSFSQLHNAVNFATLPFYSVLIKLNYSTFVSHYMNNPHSSVVSSKLSFLTPLHLVNLHCFEGLVIDQRRSRFANLILGSRFKIRDLNRICQSSHLCFFFFESVEATIGCFPL